MPQDLEDGIYHVRTSETPWAVERESIEIYTLESGQRRIKRRRDGEEPWDEEVRRSQKGGDYKAKREKDTDFEVVQLRQFFVEIGDRRVGVLCGFATREKKSSGHSGISDPPVVGVWGADTQPPTGGPGGDR